MVVSELKLVNFIKKKEKISILFSAWLTAKGLRLTHRWPLLVNLSTPFLPLQLEMNFPLGSGVQSKSCGGSFVPHQCILEL